MGRIAVAAVCIVLIVAGGIVSLRCTNAVCGDILAQIDASLWQLTETGHDDGRALTAAYDTWTDFHTGLCAFIEHDQVDQVTASFQRAMAFLSYETHDEYLAELLQLKALVQMVQAFDRPTLRNIL